MIRINLLPFRAARRKENIRRQISIFLLSFIFSGIALFYYQLQLNLQLGELKTQAEDVKSRLKIFRKRAREVDQIKQALDILKKKVNAIKTLTGGDKTNYLKLQKVRFGMLDVGLHEGVFGGIFKDCLMGNGQLWLN